MFNSENHSFATLPRDVTAGFVVFLVALPLCLGVALASNAPLFSGLLAGIVGGIVVGILSKSQVSVTAPAAGLTAIVASQLAVLGSFQAFLLAVIVAGVIQIGLGLIRAGSLAAYFPSSVIKGLLSAIGVILILKQIPHLMGRDTDPEGEMRFWQPDQETTLTELFRVFGDIHQGAALIGLISIVALIVWDRIPALRDRWIPSQLVVVLLGVGLSRLLSSMGGNWILGENHLVQVPVSKKFSDLAAFLQFPDFSQWSNPNVYTAGLTIALLASLETLLNLKAVDKLDPQQRLSPASHELMAQGIGNVLLGLIGGIPVTSVIARSSVNIYAGARSKLATIFHGSFLLVTVLLLPGWLNLIPLSCLAAILIVTGFKLFSPSIVKEMWAKGRHQFTPYAMTIVSIVLTDLLVGIGIGLATSIAFILTSNLRRPQRCILERHLGGEVMHVELANQVSFLNQAALEQVLNSIPRGGHLLLDAENTVYIDPDILGMIREFKEKTAPVRDVQVSLRGFQDRYSLQNEIQYVDYSTRELQGQLTPLQVLKILVEGNERFRSGQRLTRDLGRQLQATALGQHPLAVVLSCIDSRTPTELIFDLGLGDIFSIRIAGNITSEKVLGSMEYGCAVAGAKLIVVTGHTQCGAVTAAVKFSGSDADAAEATGCQHLGPIIHDIQEAISPSPDFDWEALSKEEKSQFVDNVARQNVLLSVERILNQSQTIARLVKEGRIEVIGAMYDVVTGRIEFFTRDTCALDQTDQATLA